MPIYLYNNGIRGSVLLNVQWINADPRTLLANYEGPISLGPDHSHGIGDDTAMTNRAIVQNYTTDLNVAVKQLVITEAI